MLAAQTSHVEMWERMRIIETLFLEGSAENKARKQVKAHLISVSSSAFPSWSSLAGGHLLWVGDPRLLHLGNITWSGKNVFKFSEHFPLALSICSYHSGVGAWQELEMTYTKLCISWSQPRSLRHCHVKLHHSWPLSAERMTPVRNFQVSARFFIRIAYVAWTRKGWHLGWERNGQCLLLSASSACQFEFSLNLSEFRSNRLVI